MCLFFTTLMMLKREARSCHIASNSGATFATSKCFSSTGVKCHEKELLSCH
ncbi:hypothetical protein NC653_008914 [Populus alba x Populus x berolinensis]|uniref:Uncharacterized protein n=1 Tax=Populus alba x Populus x berolinensis TaxID=444605 RepID=A0AAD6W957_9ROSI|nr:hypothetical protein NC653_008914 [Populus alba x Populus x berolinensis]